MKPEITCLQSMALKGGTAKSGSLQVKFLFSDALHAGLATRSADPSAK